MVLISYIFILCYFLLGGIGIYFINRKKEKAATKAGWTKFTTYFVIINILFFSIVIHPMVFRTLSGLIIAVGTVELFRLFQKDGFRSAGFFVVSIVFYGILAFGFWNFSEAKRGIILYTFLILSIFDAFSQISGQLWGKRKVAVMVSPNKTAEGILGGATVALLSAFFLKRLLDVGNPDMLFLTTGILFFAYSGDIAASFYKRKFKVKDYSNLIPGHGGFLDRFDSLIAGGAWVALFLTF